MLQNRWALAQAEMRQKSYDALILAPSSDLVYLADYAHHPSERPTLMVMPQRGLPALILPAFEVPKLSADLGEQVQVMPWGETDNPYNLALSFLGTGPGRAAIGDQMWALFVINLQRHLKGWDFGLGSDILSPLRMVKDSNEIEHLRQAQHLAGQALAKVLEAPFAGRSERQVADVLFQARQSLGLNPEHVGSVASGPNGSSPHHSAGDRIIAEGDTVIIDFGGDIAGYQADLTRTVQVGRAGPEVVKAYQIVKDAQEAAVQSIRPGVTCESVDSVAREIIAAAGYGSYFIHRTGHGIGLDEHEDPYLVQGNSLPLEPGMTITVEPGIYIPGRFGIRIEDVVAVTDRGHDRLTQVNHDLVTVA
ncbi:MAG: Xaa-Pro peptidase family protein [Thermaerobacterales bacterium]